MTYVGGLLTGMWAGLIIGVPVGFVIGAMVIGLAFLSFHIRCFPPDGGAS